MSIGIGNIYFGKKKGKERKREKKKGKREKRGKRGKREKRKRNGEEEESLKVKRRRYSEVRSLIRIVFLFTGLNCQLGKKKRNE